MLRCRGFPDVQRKVPGPVEGRYRHSEDKPSLTQGFPGIVTLRGDTKRHSFHDGDLVIFSDIEGMVELNSCSPQSVRVQSKPIPLQPLPQLCGNKLYLGGHNLLGWLSHRRRVLGDWRYDNFLPLLERWGCHRSQETQDREACAYKNTWGGSTWLREGVRSVIDLTLSQATPTPYRSPWT